MATTLLSACSGGFKNSGNTDASSGKLTHDGSGGLTVMIGSSGAAETNANKAAAAAWSKTSGVKVKIVAASDLSQQLSQGFASGKPPDVFYLAPNSVPGYADAGDLLAYGSLINTSDFYPSIMASAKYKGKTWGVPKDVSVLGLVIDKKIWDDAGLPALPGGAPKTWAQLEQDSKKLTGVDGTKVGLAMSGSWDTTGAFMLQNGGSAFAADGTTPTLNSPANVKGLDEVANLIQSGSAAFSAALPAGGDAGNSIMACNSAMAIDGNWFYGTGLAPGVAACKQLKISPSDMIAVPLPAGPNGKLATQQYTNLWGIAAKSKDQKDAISLVQYLSKKNTVLGFSKAFGVMPAIKSAAPQYKAAFPNLSAYADSLSWSVPDPTAPAWSTLQTKFDGTLATWKQGNIKPSPKDLLDTSQTNLKQLIASSGGQGGK